jgi:two-component system response regulator ChvI
MQIDSEGAALPSPFATRKIRILSVDDDPLYRETLLDLLSDRGFAVRGFGDAESFLDSLDVTAEAELLLLDWNLPEISGIDLLCRLRKRGINIPVAFLTGAPLVDHEEVAFVEGAVDFIDKSRGFDVLASRIARIVTTQWKPSHPAQTKPPRVVGQLSLRPGRAVWRGQDVGLTYSEYIVINLLTSDAGTVFGYRALYDEMHYAGFVAGKGEDGYQTNVRSHIKRIRKKFQGIDPGFDEIVNQAGLGYRWRRQVQ